ncbi:unnamed protein product [Staurois parvus]|uniref:Uncharacterized protein n=1 Tax=Staurois parvus TaxID=386267 RepID=A0ABN9EVG2_9NEOB|nr:unnamed protein product [Staurois parvus]
MQGPGRPDMVNAGFSNTLNCSQPPPNPFFLLLSSAFLLDGGYVRSPRSHCM